MVGWKSCSSLSEKWVRDTIFNQKKSKKAVVEEDSSSDSIIFCSCSFMCMKSEEIQKFYRALLRLINQVGPIAQVLCGIALTYKHPETPCTAGEHDLRLFLGSS